MSLTYTLTVTIVPRSTQPSALHGMVKWPSVISNGDSGPGVDGVGVMHTTGSPVSSSDNYCSTFT